MVYILHYVFGEPICRSIHGYRVEKLFVCEHVSCEEVSLRIPFKSGWERMALMVKSKASVSCINGLVGSGWRSTSAEVKVFLSVSNGSWAARV